MKEEDEWGVEYNFYSKRLQEVIGLRKWWGKPIGSREDQADQKEWILEFYKCLATAHEG